MNVISICMATYNGEKYIARQVESILKQLSADDELVVSDDGSDDKIISILESFNDDRIKIFSNSGKKGPVGNFENALSKATGDIIFLADQDDIWLENKIAVHLSLHESFDLVISDAHVVNEFGEIIYESFFDERGSKAGLLSNLIKNSYIGCCMSFNRRILNYALPFPGYIHMHDWWIGLIGELKGRTVFFNKQLINYVRHQNNASPTLSTSGSGYSGLRRLKNRFKLLYGLFFIAFKRI